VSTQGVELSLFEAVVVGFASGVVGGVVYVHVLDVVGRWRARKRE